MKTVKCISDDELVSSMKGAWADLREAMADWQELCREQARRDSIKRRCREAAERETT